jgi:putative hydrolase of the HAD superfamily
VTQPIRDPAASLKAILFDYGMVLSGPPRPAAWATMQRLTGLDEVRLHAAYWAPRLDYDRGIHTGSTYWRAVGEYASLALDDDAVQALLAADNALWTQPNQPMIDWALRLHAAGTSTGILSNLGDRMTAGVLQAFPWLADFTHRTWSHTLLLTKPDPAIYAHAAEGLAVPPGSILFIDDREDNIAGGQAAGMQTIRYTGQTAFEEEMEGRGWGGLWRTGRLPDQPAQ